MNIKTRTNMKNMKNMNMKNMNTKNIIMHMNM